jgi:hypothetical protein
MPRRLALTTALAAALLVAGCGSGNGQHAATASSPSPTTTTAAATPTTTTTAARTTTAEPRTLTIAEAGRRYLAIVKPRNAAMEKWSTVTTPGHRPKLRALRAAATTYANADSLMLHQLLATAWPTLVVSDIRDIEKQEGAEIYWLRTVQNAKTLNEAIDIVNTGGPSDDASPAELIRAKLGLPEPPS